MSKAREYNLKQIMRRCGNWRIGAQVCGANRSDAIKAMRECADRLERKEELARVKFPE